MCLCITAHTWGPEDSLGNLLSLSPGNGTRLLRPSAKHLYLLSVHLTSFLVSYNYERLTYLLINKTWECRLSLSLPLRASVPILKDQHTSCFPPSIGWRLDLLLLTVH